MRIGQMLRFPAIDYTEGKQKLWQDWEVIEIYPNLVLCQNERGTKRCFNLGDLAMQGLLGAMPQPIESSGWSIFK